FPEDKEVTAKELDSQTKGKNTLTFENRYLTKNGDICWLSWNCNTSPEEGLVYATAKNITEEKRLRELNLLTSKLARIGSWEIDVVANKLYWSNMLYEIHETTPEEFNPDLETGINLYREEYRSLVSDTIAKTIETGESFDIEAVLITFNNNERWIRAIGEAEMVNGKCIRIY